MEYAAGIRLLELTAAILANRMPTPMIMPSREIGHEYTNEE